MDDDDDSECKSDDDAPPPAKKRRVMINKDAIPEFSKVYEETILDGELTIANREKVIGYSKYVN